MFRKYILAKNTIIAFFLFCFAILYITYPLVFHVGDRVTGYGDELVIAWIQNWVIHVIETGNVTHLFNANLYYPFHNSFAYSDAFITSSVVSLIPLLLIKQPIAVVNITLITSLIALGFSMYLLSFYITKDFFASLLSGFLVVFSPAMLDKVVHLQTVAIAGVPCAILFFLLFLDRQKTRYLIFSLLCFVLQTYNSFIPGYFIVFSYVVILCFYVFAKNKKITITSLITPKNVTLIIISLLLIIPIAIPYYQVSREFHYVRDIRETIHFALQPEDLLNAGSISRLQTILRKIPYVTQTSQYGEVKPGFIGGIFSLLAIIALIRIFLHVNKSDWYTKIFSGIAVLGFILSFGPFLHLNRQTIHKPFPIPLPYALLYYIIPGFKGIRDSERWEVLFVLSIAVVIAIMLHNILGNVSLKKRLFIYALLFLGVIMEFHFPLPVEPVPQTNQFPKVYAWLSTRPKDTKMIFLPIYNWDQFPYTQQELWREYYSTVEFRDMVNGYSGFSPPPWQLLVKDLYQHFPTENSIVKIKKLHINYIIVDKKAYDLLYHDGKKKMDGLSVVKILDNSRSVRFVKQFGDDYVFAFKK